MMRCNTCKGEGVFRAMWECTACHGEGYIEYYPSYNMHVVPLHGPRYQCALCSGRGEVLVVNDCSVCKGRGQVPG